MNLLRNLLAALAAATLLLGAGTASGGDVVTMGIFPRKPATETRAAYEPLAKRLSAATGKRVEIRLFHDYESFWKAVQARELDLVHYSQVYYLKSHRDLAYDAVLVNEESGAATMSAALAVRTDSGIRSVADLKGKKILFGGSKQAMQGYVGQVQLLRAAGLREGDYEEAFAVNTPNALIGAFNKAADAAASGDHLIDHPSIKKKIDVGQMKLLAKGEPVPGLVWAVKRELDPALVKAIARTMTGLRADPAGAELLKGAEVTGFQPIADKDYDVVRRIVKDATGEQY
jgi:phosphonate transport system substrate-binding protein